MGHRRASATRRSLATATYLFSPIVLDPRIRPCPSSTSNSFHARCLWRFVETVSRSFPSLPASALLTGQGSRSFLCNEIICWLRPCPCEIRVKSARAKLRRLQASLKARSCSKIYMRSWMPVMRMSFSGLMYKFRNDRVRIESLQFHVQRFSRVSNF